MKDCIIVGGGPAGLTAGLYATRGGMKEVTMYELGMPGGQITGSSEIENYPGVKEVVTGMELMKDWPEQCGRFGLKQEMGKVSKISVNEDGTFKVTLENGDEQCSKTVIVATGSKPKKAGFLGEEEFFGKGVSTCATCDGFFYKGREVAVLGGGDTALEEALYLANIASKVYLIHRRDTFKASPATIKRVENTDNIKLLTNCQIEEVVGDNTGVNGVSYKDINGESHLLSVPGIFVFVGRDVINDSLKETEGKFICNVNANGEVVVDLKMKTSVPGLYAAGDIRIEAPKQVVCAASDGATAALSAIHYLQTQSKK